MISAQEYAIASSATIGLTYAAELEGFYTLSPFVWRMGDEYRMLLRLVNRAADAHDKVARIHYATSRDGIAFALDANPAIAPDADAPDCGGCEDPTALEHDGELLVYYTGFDARSEHAQLLLARGSDARSLRKAGVAIPWAEHVRNPKEATVVQCGNGTWAMFFEYVVTETSRIGLARADRPDGPWTMDGNFDFHARSRSWDQFHLSPGPLDLSDPQRPALFYNGSEKGAAWRIGWAAFDADFTGVVARCDEPIIVPPLPDDGETDIAFAASAVSVGDGIDVYYSVADKGLKRATLRVSRS